RDCFDYELYWQRSIVEALIGAVKRLFGGHVRSRNWRTQRAEINSKLITYNIGAQKHPIC
ncbi:MAG: transposase, partial [Nanoarchaeota archaeon]